MPNFAGFLKASFAVLCLAPCAAWAAPASCPEGYYVANATDTECSPAGIGYFHRGNQIYRWKCWDGTTTADATSARSETDCYKILSYTSAACSSGTQKANLQWGDSSWIWSETEPYTQIYTGNTYYTYSAPVCAVCYPEYTRFQEQCTTYLTLDQCGGDGGSTAYRQAFSTGWRIGGSPYEYGGIGQPVVGNPAMPTRVGWIFNGIYSGTSCTNLGTQLIDADGIVRNITTTFPSSYETIYASWTACAAGYNLTDAGTCELPCAAGITNLHAGGLTIPLYKSKLTSPAIHIQHNGQVCYASLAPGAASNALNINYGGNTYHTIK